MKRSNIALTPTLCQRTKPGPTKVTLWDASELGLALVITPAGNRCWWFVARRAGKQIWVRIGEYHQAIPGGDPGEVWTVHAARIEAGKLRKLHDEGKDIRAEVKAKRNPHDFDALAKDYLASVGYRELAKRSQQNYKGYLENHIQPLIGKRLVEDLTHKDIVAMHRAIEAKGIRITAGFCVDLVSSLLDYASDIGWRQRVMNPCRGVKVVRSEDRERVITADELERIGASLGEGHKADIIRLIAVSGMRVGEAVAVTWSDINWNAMSVTITEHKTKKISRSKVIPINSSMGEILKAQAGHVGPWVWRGRKLGHFRAVSLDSWWADVKTAAKVPDVWIHDFRRTFETVGVELGFPPADMDVLVGHKLPGMQATYIHLSPGGILAQASEATSAWISAALNGKKPRLGVRVGAGETSMV
ncbi:tyrosine-type recombinase/integrase [Mesoterricola silvestris]|uniref:Tyr recombinase domain-containing protein n=1 Tax=Mesoterricola silvestris TaxID=2927979 RepID=A0AA48GMN1_9BACT|nr:site-specific integrase [Mesoterricola silvestris]BDU72310.1 hypothetical protein METEAL_14840 [Mesoterricola silvestris]